MGARNSFETLIAAKKYGGILQKKTAVIFC
jgi:hypothetical protein